MAPNRGLRWSAGVLALCVGACAAAGTDGSIEPATGVPAAVATSVATSTEPSLPSHVDGLAVQTVSELLEARAGGKARGGPHALRGYWTFGDSGPLGCTLLGDQADLALACQDEDWGITERHEAMFTLEAQAFGYASLGPSGPWLQPWVASDAHWDRLRSISPDRRQVPVPIVVVGHFDDPLAADCRPSTRQMCLDRFVLEQIVEFDPASAPDPTPGPGPTPFPLADPPPPPISEADCYPGREKSFVGWARLRDLGVKLDELWEPDSYVYAIVTQDAVLPDDVSPKAAWHADADYPGHKVRWWARAACLAEPPGTTLHGSWVLGSSYLEVDDGRRIHAPYPFPQ